MQQIKINGSPEQILQALADHISELRGAVEAVEDEAAALKTVLRVVIPSLFKRAGVLQHDSDWADLLNMVADQSAANLADQTYSTELRDRLNRINELVRTFAVHPAPLPNATFSVILGGKTDKDD